MDIQNVTTYSNATILTLLKDNAVLSKFEHCYRTKPEFRDLLDAAWKDFVANSNEEYSNTIESWIGFSAWAQSCEVKELLGQILSSESYKDCHRDYTTGALSIDTTHYVNYSFKQRQISDKLKVSDDGYVTGMPGVAYEFKMPACMAITAYFPDKVAAIKDKLTYCGQE